MRSPLFLQDSDSGDSGSGLESRLRGLPTPHSGPLSCCVPRVFVAHTCGDILSFLITRLSDSTGVQIYSLSQITTSELR